jgi:hypothetical protein
MHYKLSSVTRQCTVSNRQKIKEKKKTEEKALETQKKGKVSRVTINKRKIRRKKPVKKEHKNK